ncbi:hypothetical protein LV89_02010 [Arcicella aurantiaca]|uniref:Uncharacterized protein n=1 Tax=Arcicella aurantiaca TaxID=591202 RepID=A0A316ECV0_9BACT|nr:hypothetical protein [Arcicella aurantiaca]PWK27195.1 hypothetical protein LV89_02010 [Arcicella aurantiaca]
MKENKDNAQIFNMLMFSLLIMGNISQQFRIAKIENESLNRDLKQQKQIENLIDVLQNHQKAIKKNDENLRNLIFVLELNEKY